jgi:hypothetical protein
MTRRSVTPIQRRSVVRTQWSVADEDTSKNQGRVPSELLNQFPRRLLTDEEM